MVWVIDPPSAAVVLGSTQSDEVVNRPAAEARGLSVVRRRSGGGAVLVVPGDVVWLDVIVPRGDVLWSDDVGIAAERIGAVWLDALRPWLPGAWVHTGAMVSDDLARLVCFAGTGPGEVLTLGAVPGAPSAKVVGISQRRMRNAARFQCACVLRWDPAALLELLPALATLDTGSEWHRRVRRCGGSVAANANQITEAFVAALAATGSHS